MRAFCLLVVLTSLAAAPAAAADEPRPWLGVYLDDPRAAGVEGEPDPAPRGIVVRRVVAGGPADEAGLRARDRILSVDGVAVGSMKDFVARLSGAGPGTWITLEVRRGEGERPVRVRLGERPERVSSLPLREGWIGVAAIDLPPSLRTHFGAPEDAGVMISVVEPGSPAEAAGLSPGDVLFAVDGEPVASTRELKRLVAGGGIENTLELTVARGGAELVAEATVAERPPDDEAADDPR